MAAGCDQLQVLQLACPVDFSSLVRVFVPLRDGADAATAARAVRRLLHSSTGACVVQVLNHTALQVVCHKAIAAKAYKTLTSAQQQQQQQLGVAMGDVKSTISLSVPPMELQRCVEEALRETLLAAGWHRLGGAGGATLIKADFLRDPFKKYNSSDGRAISLVAAAAASGAADASASAFESSNGSAAGASVVAPCVSSIDVQIVLPNVLVVVLHGSGAARFTPFPSATSLPKHLALQLDTALQQFSSSALLCSASSTAATAAGGGSIRSTIPHATVALLEQTAQQLTKACADEPCVLLPFLVPAVVRAVRPAPDSGSTAMGALAREWRDRYGYDLPPAFPYVYEVAPDVDSRETICVPSCCVWAAPGLVPVAERLPGGMSAEAVRQLVAADVASSDFKFWGSANLRAPPPAQQFAGSGGSGGHAAAAAAPHSAGAGAAAATAAATAAAAYPAAMLDGSLTLGLIAAAAAGGGGNNGGGGAAADETAAAGCWLSAADGLRAGSKVGGPVAAGGTSFAPFPSVQQLSAAATAAGGGGSRGAAAASNAAGTAATLLRKPPVPNGRPTNRTKQRGEEQKNWSQLQGLLGKLQAGYGDAGGGVANNGGSGGGGSGAPAGHYAGKYNAHAAQRQPQLFVASTSGGGSGAAVPTAVAAAAGATPITAAAASRFLAAAALRVPAIAAGRAGPQAAAAATGIIRKPAAAVAAASSSGAKTAQPPLRPAAAAGRAPLLKTSRDDATAVASLTKVPAPKKPKLAPAAPGFAAAAPLAAAAGAAAAAMRAAVGTGGADMLNSVAAVASGSAAFGASAAAYDDDDDDFEPTAAAVAARAAAQLSLPVHAAAAAAGAAPAASAGTAAAAAAKKRTKASDLDVACVRSKVASLHAAGRLRELSVPEMQCYLRSSKQPVGGKKADLEARLAALLGGGGGSGGGLGGGSGGGGGGA